MSGRDKINDDRVMIGAEVEPVSRRRISTPSEYNAWSIGIQSGARPTGQDGRIPRPSALSRRPESVSSRAK